MEKGQDGQNEDEGIMEEKEHDKEEAAWSLKLVPGHGNSMTIQVRSTGKDKAQLIAVSEKACSDTEWSPLTACEHILKQIEGAAAGQLRIPVAKSAALAELRALSQSERDLLFG